MSKSTHTKTNKGGSILPALCSFIGTGLLIVVLLLLIPLTMPKIFGYEMYNVVSGSMDPAIPKGSLILVEPVTGEQIQEDDVIAFYKNGSIVTHRVTYNNRVDDFFRTKGDANENEDFEVIEYKSLVGRVKFHIPRLGDFCSNLTSAFGKMYLLALIVLGLLFHLLAVRLRDLLE